MVAQLCLDSDTDSVCKTIGEISAGNRAICFDGVWEQQEELMAKEIQEKVMDL